MKNTWWFRSISIFLALTMAYSATAAGIHVAASTFSESIQNMLRRPGAFTDVPTKVFKGSNPKRDPVFRAGRWTPETLAGLAAARAHGLIEDMSLWQVATGEFAAAILQAGGGGSGGGEGGGEGGGSGGGSGGGGAPGAAGGSGGEGGAGQGSGSGGGSGAGASSSSVNTNTGNRQYNLPIVGWPSRGAVGVGLTLSHSSLGDNWNGTFGYGWTHSYEWKIDYSQNEYCIVHAGDGSDYAFSESMGTFSPPTAIYLTLIHNTNGTWTLTTKSGWKLDFASTGLLSTIKDRNNNTVTIARDGSNRVSTVTDPGGKVLTFAYDSNGKVSSVTDPLSRVWTFGYSTGGDLTGVTYPTLDSVNYTRTFGYNATHDITSEVDLRGNTWTCTYDTQQRMTSWSNPLSQTTSYSYGASATTITLPGSQTIVHNYSSGLLASEVDPASFSTAYTYDSSKNLLTVTDKRGKVWTYTYDSKGNVLTAKNPLNQTTTITYNSAFSQPLTVTDPLGNVSTMTYDSSGNLLTTVDPLSRTKATLAYDSYGQLQTVTDALNHTTTLTRDSHGNVNAITDPLNHSRTVAYDTINRPTSFTDGVGNTFGLIYDVWGRPVQANLPGNVSSSTAYNSEGQSVTVTNPLGKSLSYTYDNAGRLTSFTDARGYITSFAYNSNGWVTSMTSPKSEVTSYSYNARGQVTSYTTPDSIVRSKSYDGNGGTSARTNGLSQTVSYVRDDAGRLISVDYPTGTDTSFSYDAGGRRTQMVDGTGTTAWTYNAASEITGLSSPQNVLSYAYDTAGRLSSYTQTGVGATSLSYDNANRLTSVTNPHSETSSWEYDNANRPVVQTHGNRLKTYVTYDARSRITAIDHKTAGGTVLGSETYTWDAANRPITKTSNGVTTTYGFDVANHLTSESRAGRSASYTYDQNGNRASKTLNGVTETYTYSLANRILTAGSFSFTYDGNSRRATMVGPAGTTSYGYDHDDRMTSVTLPNSSTISYVYNGLGSRVGRNTEVYKRAGPFPGSPMLADGSASYTPGLSERRGSASSFFHFDAGNDLAWQSDTGGSMTDYYQFDWFGLLIGHTGSSTTPVGDNGGSGGYTDPGSGDVNTGGGVNHEPPFGGGPSIAPIQGLEGAYFDPNGNGGGSTPGDWSIDLANGVAAFGDHISCGLTNWIRELSGYNEVIDTNSTAYQVGTTAAYVYDGVSVVAGGGAIISGIRNAKAAATIAKDGATVVDVSEVIEFHHIIPRAITQMLIDEGMAWDGVFDIVAGIPKGWHRLVAEGGLHTGPGGPGGAYNAMWKAWRSSFDGVPTIDHVYDFYHQVMSRWGFHYAF